MAAPRSYTDLCYTSGVAFNFQPGPAPVTAFSKARETFSGDSNGDLLPAAATSAPDATPARGFYAQYRLVTAAVLEAGALDKYAAEPRAHSGFPETFPRAAGDIRPPDYLGRELLARVLNGEGHTYVLQVRPISWILSTVCFLCYSLKEPLIQLFVSPFMIVRGPQICRHDGTTSLCLYGCPNPVPNQHNLEIG